MLTNCAPLAAGAPDIAQPLDYPAHFDTALVAARLGRWDHHCHVLPFVIRQIARIPQLAPIVSRSVLVRPHLQTPRITPPSIESQMTHPIQYVHGRTLRLPTPTRTATRSSFSGSAVKPTPPAASPA